MARNNTVLLYLWAVIMFIISVATSCEMQKPIPGAANWNITGELRYRANQQLKEVP